MEHSIFKLTTSILIPLITSLITILLALRKRKTIGKKTFRSMIPFSKNTGTYEGVEYKYHYSKGGDKSPSYFTIYIKCQSAGSFRITRENKLDRFFINLGVCKKIKTGDPEFDDKFFVSTTTEDFTRTFFGYRKNRDVVKNLYEKKFSSVLHNGKEMMATRPNLRFTDEIDPSMITQIVSYLIVLTKDVPPFTTPVFYSTQSWKFSRALAFTIPALAESLGIVALVLGLLNFKPLDIGQAVIKSLMISIPSLIIFLWLTLKLLSGRTSSHIEFLIASIISLTAFPIAGAGGLIFLNGKLDKTAPVEHKVAVVEKFARHSEDTTDYYAILKSWRVKKKRKNYKYDTISTLKLSSENQLC